MNGIPTIPEKQNSAAQVRLLVKKEASSETISLLCPKGSNLLDTLQANHIFLPACCGGNGKCGKCGVIIHEEPPSGDTSMPYAVTADDRAIFSDAMLQSGMRLACRATINNNLTILIPTRKTADFTVIGAEKNARVPILPQRKKPSGDYGIAIDVGTTTLAYALIDLRDGTVLAARTSVNPQRAFGADIISRIQAANSGKGAQLCDLIKKELKNYIYALSAENGLAPYQICHIAIAGNTAMLHLLREYSCEGFLQYPFAPKTLDLEEFSFFELFGEKLPAKVTLLPGISAFVGADIVSGIYACGMQRETGPSLLIDLGTNGEMALRANGRIFAASAAAGPAFEGGSLTCGTGSVAGAISQVKIQDFIPHVQTIQNALPAGICGTGAIEAVAELLRAGIIDDTGKLADPYFKEGYSLAQTASQAKIRLTQQDIREIQLAKAAIRSGIELLISHAGINPGQLSRVYLAGGFGAYLDVEKAAAIGLLPKPLSKKTVPAGNASLYGTLLYLANQDTDTLLSIQKQAQELPLAKEDAFHELYIHFMNF